MLININRKDHLIELRSKQRDRTIRVRSLTPKDACLLMDALNANASKIHDLATHYYDCPECGQVHHNDVKQCPDLLAREEEDL